MDRKEAEKVYRRLKQQLGQKKMSQAEYELEAVQLRYQDAAGTWWQIRPEDGVWLSWDGSRWTADRKMQPVAKPRHDPAGPKKEQLGEPETLAQLVVVMLKGIVGGLKRRLAVMAVLILAVWVLHTYLLVGPNNGFWKVTTAGLGMILALRGRMVGGTLFWMLTFGVLSTLITMVRQQGAGGFLRKLGSVSPELRRARRATPAMDTAILLGAAALALIPAALIGNRLVSLLAAVAVFLSLSLGFSGFLFMVVRLGWSDFYRWFKLKGLKVFRPYAAYLFIAGLVGGLLLGAILPYHPYSGLLAAAMLFILAFFGRKKMALPGAASLIFFAVLFMAHRVWGHDGGAYEVGGWDRWLGSTGSLTAIMHGLPPALGAALGTVLGAGALQGTQLPVKTTRILDGPDAIRWLENQGLMVGGVLTDLFWNGWHNHLGEGNPYGLGAIAGEWMTEDRDRVLENLTIVVEGEDRMPADQEAEDLTDKDEPDSDSGAADQNGADDDDAGDDAEDTKKTPPVIPVKEPEVKPKPPDVKVPPVAPGPVKPEVDEHGMPLGIKPRDYLINLMNQLVLQRSSGENGPRYWVTNRDLSRLGLNHPLPGRPLIQFLTTVLNHRLTRPIMEYLAGWQGGTCGDFAEWGMHWVKDDVRRTFGEGAFIDQIILQRNSMINHAATKVVLPNGDRYIMDFWDGIQDVKPHVYTEEEWLNKWKPQMGGNPEVSSLSYMESNLKNLVSILGDQEEAFEMFLDSNKNDPTAQTLINSYRRNPW